MYVSTRNLPHKRGLQAQKHAQAMSAFVTRNATEADQVTRAEVKMAMLCAKNKCVADMFPDSAIARKYSTGKTKATQIIKDKLASHIATYLSYCWATVRLLKQYKMGLKCV